MPANSRSSSSLGSSIIGLDARVTLSDAVNPDVAPLAGTFSVTGDEMISSRVGIGRLMIRQLSTRDSGEWCRNLMHTYLGGGPARPHGPENGLVNESG